jgi:hypothetical protein
MLRRRGRGRIRVGAGEGDPITVGGEEGDGGWVRVVLGRVSGIGEERMRRGSADRLFWDGEEERIPVIEGEAAAAVWMLGRQGIFDPIV